MNKRPQIAKAALKYLDTPYHHQGRVKGVGIDCAGLIICVARDLGLSDYDLDGYSRHADGVSLIEEFSAHCDLKTRAELGDILVFKVRRRPTHCGIYLGNDRFIHAHSTAGKVVAHALDIQWKNRIVAIYQYPGVA